MSVDSEPAIPEENLQNIVFTWGIFVNKEGIPFLGVVPLVNGQPVLSRVLKMTETLEDFEKLYQKMREVLEGPKPKTRMYD